MVLPLAAGIAILLWGALAAANLARFGFWLALALVGQAAALQLVDAGPMVRYQHYKAIPALLNAPIPLLVVAAQAGITAAALLYHRREVADWLARHIRWWQAVGLGALFFAFAATVSRDVQFYAYDLLVAGLIQVINLGTVALTAAALPAGALARFWQWCDWLLGPAIAPARLDRFAAAAALWTAALAAALSWLVYQQHPHVPDEVVYLYHARYLAAGSLTTPAPPAPQSFSFFMIPFRAADWYSIFPPGWPAVLALGWRVGLPWLVNPLLAGVNILLAYLLVQALYHRRLARLVVLLLAVSPWHIFMAMSFMAHTFTTTCLLLAALGIIWAKQTGQSRWAAVAGLSVGMISLIRPLDGLLAAGLLGLWAVVGPRVKLPGLLAFGLAALLVGAATLPYNAAVTGQPLTVPLTEYYRVYFGPNANALGFGPGRGFGWPIDPFPGHSPLEAMINANLNLFALNIELFGWSAGSLLLVGVWLFFGGKQKQDWLMLTLAALTVAVYSLYWFSSGPDFGARYWYLALVPLVVLSARGLQRAQALAGPRVGLAAAVLAAAALLTFFPWRALDKYYHYRGAQPGIEAMAQQRQFGRGLILIRGNSDDYQSAWLFNPLDYRANAPIYAWDQSPAQHPRLLEVYPNRPVWVVNGPSVTGGGFEVAAGPLTGPEFLAWGQVK
jgi:hypothetical protein